MRGYNNIYFKNEGYGMTLPLSQFNDDEKYYGYAVFCMYQYRKKEEKYQLHMWLKSNKADIVTGIKYKDIDAQLISGDRSNIRDHICRIVEQAMKVGYFDEQIDQFAYIMACYDEGNKRLGS